MTPVTSSRSPQRLPRNPLVHALSSPSSRGVSAKVRSRRRARGSIDLDTRRGSALARNGSAGAPSPGPVRSCGAARSRCRPWPRSLRARPRQRRREIGDGDRPCRRRQVDHAFVDQQLDIVTHALIARRDPGLTRTCAGPDQAQRRGQAGAERNGHATHDSAKRARVPSMRQKLVLEVAAPERARRRDVNGHSMIAPATHALEQDLYRARAHSDPPPRRPPASSNSPASCPARRPTGRTG